MSITLQLVLLLSPSDVLPGESPSSFLLRMVSCTATHPCVQRIRRSPDLAACARLGAGGRAASKHPVHKSIHGLSVKMFRGQTSPYYERPFGQRSREKSQALSEPTKPSPRSNPAPPPNPPPNPRNRGRSARHQPVELLSHAAEGGPTFRGGGAAARAGAGRRFGRAEAVAAVEAEAVPRRG